MLLQDNQGFQLRSGGRGRGEELKWDGFWKPGFTERPNCEKTEAHVWLFEKGAVETLNLDGG